MEGRSSRERRADSWRCKTLRHDQQSQHATVLGKCRRGCEFERIGSRGEGKTSEEAKPKEVSQSTWLIPKGSGEIFAARKSLRKAKWTLGSREQL